MPDTYTAPDSHETLGECAVTLNELARQLSSFRGGASLPDDFDTLLADVIGCVEQWAEVVAE